MKRVGPPAATFSLRPTMPQNLTVRFTTEVVRLDSGLRFHILPLPNDVAARLRAGKVRRLITTVNGHTINRGLQWHADGGAFLILGRSLLAELGLKRGSRVEVSLKPDPRPDSFELPEELSLTLAQDDAARERWETFTPGFRRSLAYYVSTAKTEPTRIKRSLELAHKIRTRTLYSDRNNSP